MSTLSRAQWWSVAKNLVFAFVSVYTSTVVVTGSTPRVGVTTALMAVLKIVEKLLTPVEQ